MPAKVPARWPRLRARRPLGVEHAPAPFAFLTVDPASWAGTVQLGSTVGHQPTNGAAALHGVELIYRDVSSMLVLRLCKVIPSAPWFDPGAAATLTRVGQLDVPPTTPSVRTFRRVAGLHVDVFQTPPNAGTQQAVFAWRHTHVSVASHGLPLDDAWFARLVL